MGHPRGVNTPSQNTFETCGGDGESYKAISRRNFMERLALLALLQSKPGKEAEVEAFLKSALPLAVQEKGTVRWYALKLGSGRFGIFDTFADAAGKDAHLSG